MANRKIFTAIEARIRADEINERHGTTIVLQGGGPMRAKIQDRTLSVRPLSPWLTRQAMITWLDAFELGLIQVTKGRDAAADRAAELLPKE